MDKKVTAILTADWHLRDDQPICRIDNYFDAQEEKIAEIYNLQIIHDCPIFCAGDLFHKARSSPFLEAWSLQFLPENIEAIPGNHDLPNHNSSFESYNTSSLYVLAMARKAYIWGASLGEIRSIGHWGDKKVGMIHTMVHKDKSIHPDIKSTKAIDLLKQYPEYDLIVSGDNHKPFVQEYEGRLLVNPGSLMRMTADQMDHKPRVYLWYSEDNTIEPVYLPIEDNVITREHIEIKEKRDKRIETFVNRVKDDYDISLSFEQNLESFFDKNKIRKSIQNIIWDCLDDLREIIK